MNQAEDEDTPPLEDPDPPQRVEYGPEADELARELHGALERHGFGFVGAIDGSSIGNAHGGPMTVVDAHIDLRAAASEFAAILAYRAAADNVAAKAAEPPARSSWEPKCELCEGPNDNDLGSDICTACETRAAWRDA